MRIHILGVAGTFMAGIAILAKQLGHQVSGSDQQFYPPMGDQLKIHGITAFAGYQVDHLQPHPDLVIIGNAMSRGNPAVEYVLNEKIPYVSGPQWLAENVLQQRKVIAVAGTHGKTTVSSMVAWILTEAGLQPGFAIGGVPKNFASGVELGQGEYFVIEGDEYDSAFFDKRSKFIHYRPDILLLNNLEYDHADIFSDLEAIKRQFQFLLRLVPSNGTVIYPAEDENIKDVVARGCWSMMESFSLQVGDWQASLQEEDGSAFEVSYQGNRMGRVAWQLSGNHNVLNALEAIAAADKAGVAPAVACGALGHFRGVKRRLELRGIANGVAVYDDFAHHPTAIATTLAGMRKKMALKQRLFAILEFGSYTMRSGAHGGKVFAALGEADEVFIAKPAGQWNYNQYIKIEPQVPIQVCANADEVIQNLLPKLQSGDQVVVMSNRSFDGLHDKLLKQLNHKESAEI